jgi:hypothetical protein
MVPKGQQAVAVTQLERINTGMTAESSDSGAGPPSEGGRLDETIQKAEEDEDAAYEVDDLADTKPKKRRKIIKNSDKKYQCPQPDCGKAYSRAEHLYRHQLNRMFSRDHIDSSHLSDVAD